MSIEDNFNLKQAATLACLDLSDSELAELSVKAAKIINAFEVLKELDVSRVEPLYTFKSEIELREDEPFEELLSEEVLNLSANSTDGYFKAPRAVGGDDVI